MFVPIFFAFLGGGFEGEERGAECSRSRSENLRICGFSYLDERAYYY